MSDFIIVIASLTESISNPVKKWDFRIGIVPTDTEYDRVDEDECIEKVRKWELLIGDEYEDESDKGREDLQNPREVVMWCYRWPDEDEDKSDEEGETVAHGII